MVDKKRNTLIYVAISDKLVDGSPQNSISTVPVMPWGGCAIGGATVQKQAQKKAPTKGPLE